MTADRKLIQELTPEAIKGLASWQLYTLVSDTAVLRVFIDGLADGNPDTGEYFTVPMKAFFQALRMCGLKSEKLRDAYERSRARRQTSFASRDAESRRKRANKG